MKSKELGMKINKKTFDTCLCILLCIAYGCETWTLTKRHRDTLTSCQRIMGRSVLDLKLIDKIRSIDIRRKLTDIPVRRDEFKSRWTGHTLRCQKEKWSKQTTVVGNMNAQGYFSLPATAFEHAFQMSIYFRGVALKAAYGIVMLSAWNCSSVDLGIECREKPTTLVSREIPRQSLKCQSLACLFYQKDYLNVQYEDVYPNALWFGVDLTRFLILETYIPDTSKATEEREKFRADVRDERIHTLSDFNDWAIGMDLRQSQVNWGIEKLNENGLRVRRSSGLYLTATAVDLRAGDKRAKSSTVIPKRKWLRR
ncbi:hypothetical protein EVAR_984_1 [Eumeta japonica]|uniref:Uncharacterized protein n=1 Tax=Eumeta variegata TaxID=151549 RepID=A0A4C1SH53_EUMVA|nr:hypothetical protein EVAR_984_1 [Eumeta japonica]